MKVTKHVSGPVTQLNHRDPPPAGNTMHALWLLVVPLTFFHLGVRSDFLNANGSFDTQATLWGPYRPNLYFGLRPRIPQSLMTGLVWFGTQNYQAMPSQSVQFVPTVSMPVTDEIPPRRCEACL